MAPKTSVLFKSINQSIRWFSELQKEMGLVDVWRRANPSVTGAFTCWNQAKEARHSNDGVR